MQPSHSSLPTVIDAATATAPAGRRHCEDIRDSSASHVYLDAEKLLSSFGSGWSICIDRVPPSADMASSPLQPFLVTVARCSQQPQHTQETDGQVDDLNDIELDEGHNNSREGQIGDCPEPVSAVQLSFGADAGAVNAEQLADIIKVSAVESAVQSAKARCISTTTLWHLKRSCCSV